MSIAIEERPSESSGIVSVIEADRRFYNPLSEMESYFGDKNEELIRSMELIRPVSLSTEMLKVLDVFREHMGEHFFPVLDHNGYPVGIVCERSLKRYVYSAFGMALLANKGQNRRLDAFLTPCPQVDVSTSIHDLLEAAHTIPHSEGVIITARNKYVGFVRTSELIKLAHKQQMYIVQQHNAVLDNKNREIQAVLQNMRQGICNLLPDLTVHQDYSSHLETILEKQALAGINIMELLFTSSCLGDDKIKQIEAALFAIPEQDALTYELNSHILPTELQMKTGEKSKILELHWTPVLDGDDNVARLMLVVRDVTLMRALQAQAEKQKKELQILGEILNAGESRFNEFIESSNYHLGKCRKVLNTVSETDFDLGKLISSLYVSLHTMKGNARTIALSDAADAIHRAEQYLEELRMNHREYDGTECLHVLFGVEQSIDGYRVIYENCLMNFSGRDSKALQSSGDDVLDKIRRYALERHDSVLLKMIGMEANITIGNVIRESALGLPMIAKELAKSTPELIVSSELECFTLQISNARRLGEAMIHVLRNATDHGIESDQERIESGKPIAGTITVECCHEQEGLYISISDDGRGLDIEKIYKKALEKNLIDVSSDYDDHKVAELIFHSGFSTASSVSMISGRGVGMDAVRDLITEMGGFISLALYPRKLENQCRAFDLCIFLPKSTYSVNGA